jgi:hypothetical protein
MRRPLFSGTFNHVEAPDGCGSGTYTTPSRRIVSPTTSESRPIPSNSLAANPPTGITTSGRSSSNSRESCGLQLAIIAREGTLSPPPGALPGKQRARVER